MPEPTRPSLAIIGSCVTRDPLNRVLDEVQIASYHARTCVTSMMAEPVELEIDVDGLQAPAFEKRCIVADLRKTWVENLSVPADLVVLDFIDERFGLGVIGDQVFTYSTALRRALDEGGAVLSNMRYVSPFSEEYLRLLQANLPAFCESLSRFPNVLLNDARWTETKEDGSLFPEPEREKVKKSNAILEVIFQEISRRTSARPLGIDPTTLVAKLGHKWGDAPFHYSDATELAIGRMIVAAARRTQASSAAGA